MHLLQHHMQAGLPNMQLDHAAAAAAAVAAAAAGTGGGMPGGVLPFDLQHPPHPQQHYYQQPPAMMHPQHPYAMGPYGGGAVGWWQGAGRASADQCVRLHACRRRLLLPLRVALPRRPPPPPPSSPTSPLPPLLPLPCGQAPAAPRRRRKRRSSACDGLLSCTAALWRR